MSPSTGTTTRPALEVTGLTKRFGENTALSAVDLAIAPGRVHALIGMNGSGKSTLVKILSGFHEADEGSVLVGGVEAGDADIAFVHQDLALIEDMTIVENFSLGRAVRTRAGRIDRTAERDSARRALERFAIEHLVDHRVDELTKAEKTIVAIARALQDRGSGDREGGVLVLDEPTSTLPASETSRLLEVMRECAADGLSILFISHRLAEVLAVSDDVTVLRNGVRTMHASCAGLEVADLVRAMAGDAGAELEDIAATASSASSDATVVLAAEQLAGTVLAGVDLELHRGEVLGVAGLLGSGVEEIGRLLAGRAQPTGGRVSVDGRSVGPAMARTIGYVTADRAGDGVLSGLTARENASITTVRRYLRRGRIDVSAEREVMHRWFSDMTVYPLDTERGMQQLSGGNQQKVLFARWLSVGLDVLVAEEPTQGIDVHAKAQILAKLREAAAAGLAVVLISGEPEEIVSACDRMVVLASGGVAGSYRAPLDTTTILSTMHTGAPR